MQLSRFTLLASLLCAVTAAVIPEAQDVVKRQGDVNVSVFLFAGVEAEVQLIARFWYEPNSWNSVLPISYPSQSVGDPLATSHRAPDPATRHRSLGQCERLSYIFSVPPDPTLVFRWFCCRITPKYLPERRRKSRDREADPETYLVQISVSNSAKLTPLTPFERGLGFRTFLNSRIFRWRCNLQQVVFSPSIIRQLKHTAGSYSSGV
ncbi:hypothetical protein C8R47DRAFT_1081845 [Mycena vitilis]|nr:hypothetical protein C8R47DRAFT_1081845 [Mycena vitilis]